MQIHFVSQSLGILTTLFGWIGSALGSLIAVVIDLIMLFVGNTLYQIAIQLLGILDFVQLLFKRLAGLDTHWYGGVGREEDILLSLFQSQAVINSLIAMTIVAIAMLIIATIVQIIRVEYTTEGAKNTKGGIIGSSFKALAMFMIVPIGSFMGIFISNQLLRSIEAATNPSGTSYIAGTIFVASAHNANRAKSSVERDSSLFGILENVYTNIVQTIYGGGAGAIAGAFLVDGEGNIAAGFNNNGAFTSTKSDPVEKRYDIAEKIDRAFANKMENNNSNVIGKIGILDAESGYSDAFDYNNFHLVSIYYEIGNINFLLLFAGSIMSIYFLYMAAFGMIMRLFKATALFIISPPVVALMPLDNGNAFKQWRTNFIGSIISAYGVVIALNIFFLIMPILENIKLFDPTGIKGILNYGNNALVYLLFVIVGLMSVSKISKVISDVAGKGDDALADGTAVGKKITGAAINTVAMAYGVGHAAKMGKALMSQSKGFAQEAEQAREAGDFEAAEKKDALSKSTQDKAFEYKARSERIRKEIPEVMFKKGAQSFGGDIDKTLDNIEGPFRKKDKFEYEVDQKKKKLKKAASEKDAQGNYKNKDYFDADDASRATKRAKEARGLLGDEMKNFDTTSEGKFKSGIDKANRSDANSMTQIRKKDGLLDRYMEAQQNYKDHPDSGMAKEAFEEASARMAEAMDGLGEKLERVADVTQKAALDKLKSGQELSKGEATSIKKLTGEEAKSSRAAVAYNKTAQGAAAASTAFNVVATLKTNPGANVATKDVDAALKYLNDTKQLTAELKKLLANAQKATKVRVVDNEY